MGKADVITRPVNGLPEHAEMLNQVPEPTIRERLTQARDQAKEAAEQARLAMVANNGAMQAFDLALGMLGKAE